MTSMAQASAANMYIFDFFDFILLSFCCGKVTAFSKQKEMFGSFFRAYVLTAVYSPSQGGHTYAHPICFVEHGFLWVRHYRVMNIFRNFAAGITSMVNETYIKLCLQLEKVCMWLWRFLEKGRAEKLIGSGRFSNKLKTMTTKSRR